jgi:hypothetical protein
MINNPESDVPRLEAEIDKLVYELYDLTPEDCTVLARESLNKFKHLIQKQKVCI